MLTARAQQQILPSTGAPFILVQLQSGAVTVRTWQRPSVGFVADPTVDIHHAPPRIVAAREQQQQIMLWAQTIRTPQGELTLPAEPFPLPEFPGDHDAYVVRGYGNVTLTVPESTPLVVVNIKSGSATIAGYQGAFVVHAGAAQVHLDEDGGTGAVQGNGGFFAENSTFDRLRVRSGRGDIVMTNCRAQQIAVTSLVGSIVYDNGSFENGIARFETQRGVVAIGVNGPAQIVAHSGTGRILASNDVDLIRNGLDAQAAIQGGGPVVTVTSDTGAVAIYQGALREHPQLMRELPPRLWVAF